MDIASIIELVKQPEIIFVIILLLTTSTGKMIVKKVTEKYFGKEKEEGKHCDIDDIKDSPILKAYIEKKVSIETRISEIYRYDRVMESHVKIRRLSDSIHRLMITHFKTLVKSKREIRAYDHLLNTSLEPGRDEMRAWVKKNRLLERTETEFRVYCEETAKEIMSISSEHIDDEYFDEDFSITREELKKSDYDNIGRDIIDLIEDTLMEIREIFKQKELEIKKIRDDEE